MRRCHHTSIGDTKDILDETLRFRQIMGQRTVRGLPGWYGWTNLGRDRQRVTAEIDKATCDQGIPTLQVVILLV